MKRSNRVYLTKTFWKKPEIRAILFIILITIIASIVIEYVELTHNDQFASFWDSVWWVMVTISTVGYGDKVPVTPFGRILGVILMFFGVALLSIVTATISSKFVTRMIKEGKGLQTIKFSNHILLCGWNNQAEQILSTLSTENQGDQNVILINQLAEADIEDILSHQTKMTVRFVRGDFTRENILLRANAVEAKAAIIIPDNSTAAGKTGDERTILATLSLKTVNPKIKVYAHILDRENLSHLRKAKVDEVIVSDAYTGYLLANFVTSPGIPQFVEQLFSANAHFQIRRREIPETLIGKTFEDLSEYFRDRFRGVLLGIGQVSESFNLSELLSGDYSYLDAFIMRKFQEAGRGVKSDEQIKIILSPAPDQKLDKSNFYISIEGNEE